MRTELKKDLEIAVLDPNPEQALRIVVEKYQAKGMKIREIQAMLDDAKLFKYADKNMIQDFINELEGY